VRRRGWLALFAANALSGVSRAAGTVRTDAAPKAEAAVQRNRALVFPRDHGAHPETRIEWWYLTGWLGRFEAPRAGFQVTFFRIRTGLAEELPGRFAPRQLLFAHAALTDLGAGRHRHAERLARWNGDADAVLARASLRDTDIRIGGWTLARDGDGVYRARIDDDALALSISAAPTQPLLLQGDAGFSRKGPEERQASHYLTEPQLALRARSGPDGPETEGRAWLDHEWSDELLHPDAQGWDWIGINLADGSALTAFQLRRADGSALWAGGSWRPAGGTAHSFEPGEVRFEPLAYWTSPATGGRYPVRWRVQTPAGRFALRSLLDAQEMDGRAGTGTVYWEGLSELLDHSGRRLGLGYLEMTGYVGRLAV
jgi:predicted secreted hydrolase